MRSRDTLRLSVLRMVKTAVRNKEVEKMKTLDDDEMMAVLHTLVKQRHDSVEQFRKGGREEMAQKEEAEIRIIKDYLPADATDDELQGAIDAAIQATGASSMKDMGKVMKAALAQLAGKTVDRSRVNRIAQERLQ